MSYNPGIECQISRTPQSDVNRRYLIKVLSSESVGPRAPNSDQDSSLDDSSRPTDPQSDLWSFWSKIFILVYYYPAIDVSFEPDYTSTKLSKSSLLSTVKKKARDLLHPILDGCSPLNEDIDLVYTWVNGSEIAFK